MTWESGLSARDPHSPLAQSTGDTPSPQVLPVVICKTLSKCISGDVSLLVLWFPIWEMGMMLICPVECVGFKEVQSVWE